MLSPVAGAIAVVLAVVALPWSARTRPGSPPRRSTGRSAALRVATALGSVLLTAVLLAVTVLAQALLGLLVTGAPAAGAASVVAGVCAAAALARWTAWSGGRPPA